MIKVILENNSIVWLNISYIGSISQQGVDRCNVTLQGGGVWAIHESAEKLAERINNLMNIQR